MIYGLSAKKQSGKDLFLKIWNALIVIKHGEPLTDSEISELESDIIMHGAEYFGEGTYEKKYFAESLKEIACTLFGCDMRDLESESFKNSRIPEQWIPNKFGVETYREALQYIGTEMFRNQFHENTWVLSTISKYDNSKNWIITDVRFANEKKAIEDAGGKVIRINSTRVSADSHISETALDDVDFELCVYNDFVFSSYVRSIYEIMCSEGVFRKNK